MATTLDTSVPYDGQAVTENTWRQFMSSLSGTGVIRDRANMFNVYADSTGMQVKVQTGEVWIMGHWGSSTSEKVLPITSAHATLTRKDRVILRNDYVNNRIDVDVLAGTPGGSTPSLTQNTSMYEISLGVVTVPPTDLTIDASQVTDARHYLDTLPIYRYKLTDKSVTNSITLSSDSELVWPLSANARYSIEAYLIYEGSTAADVKFAVTGPASSSGWWSGRNLDVGTAGFAGNFDGGAIVIGTVFGAGLAGPGIPVNSHTVGTILTAEAGGNLTLQFAQNNVNATPSVLKAMSWMKCTRMP